MNKIYTFFGGRKIFWGFLNLLALFIGAYSMEVDTYEVFERGSFMLYGAMVLGNVATKAVYSQKNKNQNNEEIN